MNQPSSATDPDKENRLNAIIAEYLKRKDAGKNVSKDKILEAYPDLADGLRSYFAGEAMMDAASPAFASTKLSPKPLPSDGRETVRPGALESDTASEFESRRFSRYQLLRPLGEGAMGRVYLALDTTLDRQVALKIPKTEGTSSQEFMARFTREAKAAAGLKHPNICSVYDAGEHEGTAFITMDYIDGVPLSRFIGSRKLQSVESVLQMITIIAEAVGHAHDKGVVHRDLKPGNILIDSDFKPHVTDFGLARRTGQANESRITQEGLLIGTPAYMAPEQVKGEQSKIGPESDIYSLGVILFELLTARLPFEGKVAEMLAKVLRDNPPVPSHIRRDLSEDVDDVCLKMLKKEPGQRYASMADVITAIAKLPKNAVPTTTVSPMDTARSQSPYAIQKAHVEVMLKKGQYAAAIQELEKLAAEKSPGAKAVGEWARATLPIARAESKALSPAGLAALLQTGQQMFEKSDYLGCIQLLEDVPSLRRTEAMEDLLSKAHKRETDAEQLLSDIKDMERRQQIDGLESLVKRFLKLKPGNTYAKRLWEALHTYSKTPATRRKYRYEKGRLQPMPEPSLFQQWIVLSLLVGLLTFLSVTYYVLVYLKSGNQILAVHVDDEWLKSQGGELTLIVDGNEHTISAPSIGGEPLTVTVTLGEHSFSVKHGDAVVHDPKSFVIEKDGRKVLSITATDIRLENGVPVTQPASESVASSNDKPAVLAEPETEVTDKADWISLFDGSDVSRWSSLGPYQVQNGLLIANRGRVRSAAVSGDEYGDFELEAEWRITARANGGIFYRELTTISGAGTEYQLADPKHPQLDKAYQKTGALYGVIAPSEDAERPLGEWNTTRIVCRGSIAEHWLNGKKVVHYDTADPGWQELRNKSEFKTGKEKLGTHKRGHLQLHWQSGEVAFRIIKIRPIGSDVANANSQGSANLPSLAIAPFDANQALKHQQAWATAINQPVEIQNSIGMKFRIVPPGEFMMGSPDDEANRRENEGPQHRVRLTKPFYMGVTEVTQQQWFDVMQNRPWEGKKYISEGEGFPASYVNWDDANEFCQKLGAKEGAVYRLPTEAEWEFSCRAGQQAAFDFGTDAQKLPDYAWFSGNARDAGEDYAHRVATKKPNAFGLFDIQGNVAEWCLDAYSETAYTGRGDLTVDPEHKSDTDQRALRSCSWVLDTTMARAAGRGSYPRQTRTVAALGFRVVRVIADVTPDVSTASSRSDANTKSASDLDLVATGVWKPLVDSSTPLPDPTKMKFREGVLELEADLRFPELNIRDVIVRADVRKVSGWNLAISVRQTSGNVGTQTYGGVHQYQLWFDGFDSSGGDLFQINKQRGESYGLLANVHSGDKFSEEQFADVAFSAIGNEISLYVQEKKVHSVRDNDFTNGSIAIGAWKGKSLFRNVRYQTLDSPNSATIVQKADLNADPVPAVAPFPADQAAKYQEAWASYLKLPVEYTNSIGMKSRLIPPGKFTMGSTPEEIEAAKPKLDTQRDPARPGRIESEGPPQVVTLTRPFYLGSTEVTQRQYSTVVGNNPSWYSKEGKGKDLVGEEERSNAPVEVVTWLNTGEFCSRLSIHESLDSAYRITPDLITQTGVGGYRLPTEAEWEFACRAGSNTLFSSGGGEALMDNAWFRMNNSKKMPSPVGQLLPNPFGLFDMHGNVWEHVHDAWRPDSYQRLIGAAAVDPRVDVGIDGSRVVRGGCYQLWSSECRSACRDVVADGYHWASTGFRVALSIDAVRQMQTRNGSEKGK